MIEAGRLGRGHLDWRSARDLPPSCRPVSDCNPGAEVREAGQCLPCVLYTLRSETVKLVTMIRRKSRMVVMMCAVAMRHGRSMLGRTL